MNENVNISFIPKKPLARNEVAKHRKPVLGTSSILSFAVAFLFVIGAVCEFLYIDAKQAERVDIIQELVDYNNELKADDLIKGIEEVREDARKIEVVKNLLNRHVATTELFTFFERTTPRYVSFDSFNFKGSGGVVQVSAKGEALSYEVVAVLSQLYKQEKDVLVSYSLTQISLNKTGEVSFDFSGIFVPSLISYPRVHE